MSMQHGAAAPSILAQRALAQHALTPNPLPQNSGAAGAQRDRAVPAGLGGGALTRAVERWRRALLQDQARPAAGGPVTGGAGGGAAGGTGSGVGAGSPVGPSGNPSLGLGGPAADAEALAALTRRLDDSGCSYGRVSAARLESVTRAYDRLETKMNAVLMAVTGTFLSTLAGLLLYYVRGGGQ